MMKGKMEETEDEIWWNILRRTPPQIHSQYKWKNKSALILKFGAVIEKLRHDKNKQDTFYKGKRTVLFIDVILHHFWVMKSIKHLKFKSYMLLQLGLVLSFGVFPDMNQVSDDSM